MARASRSLFDTHLKFIEAIKGFGDERLDSVVPGRAYNFPVCLKADSARGVSLRADRAVEEIVVVKIRG